MKIKMDRTLGGVFGLLFLVAGVYLLIRGSFTLGGIFLLLAVICMAVCIVPDWLLASRKWKIRKRDKKNKEAEEEKEDESSSDEVRK